MAFTLLYLTTVFFFCGACFLIAFGVYFLPPVIAYIRKHKNVVPILILTVFLGWTFLGWLAALLWALNSDVEDNCCISKKQAESECNLPEPSDN